MNKEIEFFISWRQKSALQGIIGAPDFVNGGEFFIPEHHTKYKMIKNSNNEKAMEIRFMDDIPLVVTGEEINRFCGWVYKDDMLDFFGRCAIGSINKK